MFLGFNHILAKQQCIYIVKRVFLGLTKASRVLKSGDKLDKNRDFVQKRSYTYIYVRMYVYPNVHNCVNILYGTIILKSVYMCYNHTMIICYF